MAPLHSLGQNDQNEVQYDFSGHVHSTLLYIQTKKTKKKKKLKDSIWNK